MCIAIVTSPGQTVSADVFRRCWKNNAHGFGMAMINATGGEVRIEKGYMVEEHALKCYHRFAEEMKYADRYMLLHFRAATVGGVDTDNCHPFKVKGGAMIHNGTFWRDPLSKKSDSRLFAEILHNQLHFANLKENKELIQKVIGYNRVAFLFNNNETIIFSEQFNGRRHEYGQWHDGIWYSNGGWKGQYGGYYGNGKTGTDREVHADPDGWAHNESELGDYYRGRGW